MKIEVRFEPVEAAKEPTGQSLAGVGSFVMVECWLINGAGGKRYRDPLNNVWKLSTDGKPLPVGAHPPGDYMVSKVLGPVLIVPPEKPPEPPAVRLDTLDRQVWVKCYDGEMQDPCAAVLRCHDGTGRVFGLDSDDVPFPIPVGVASNYVVVGKPTGQLRIRVTDDA